MPESVGPANRELIRAQAFGFWVVTKQNPRRAVRWEEARHEDGRVSTRGRNWVEVLEHGTTREPERFYKADVELAGPHEWLTYYPAVNEPVCGWGKPRLPDGSMQYCPRQREQDQPFCRRHMTELEGSEREEPHAPGEAAAGSSHPN